MDGLLGGWIAAPRGGLVGSCVCVFGKGAMVTDGHDRSMKDDDNQLGTLSPANQPKPTNNPPPILSNDHGDLSIHHGFPPFSFSVSTISTISLKAEPGVFYSRATVPLHPYL